MRPRYFARTWTAWQEGKAARAIWSAEDYLVASGCRVFPLLLDQSAYPKGIQPKRRGRPVTATTRKRTTVSNPDQYRIAVGIPRQPTAPIKSSRFLPQRGSTFPRVMA